MSHMKVPFAHDGAGFLALISWEKQIVDAASATVACNNMPVAMVVARALGLNNFLSLFIMFLSVACHFTANSASGSSAAIT
jgi:hypothetical protein